MPQDNYKEIYCRRWKTAYTGNSVHEDDSTVELRWKDVPLGELFCGPNGVVFTKLYRFKGDPELAKIQSFPAAGKEFNGLLKNVETLEYICQLFQSVETSEHDILLYYNGRVYGRIVIGNPAVKFEGLTGDGWQTSEDPERLVTYAKWLRDRFRDNEMMDDMDIISSLGRNLAR